MSAFIVSPEHINVMIHAGLDQHGRGYTLSWVMPDSNPTNLRQLTWNTADAAARMLVKANLAGVGQHDIPNGEISINGQVYRYRPPLRAGWQPVEILKTITCYEYQSCEAPDWNQSEAHAFCRALEQWVISSMPGWEEAAWGIDPGTLPSDIEHHDARQAGR